MRTTPGGQLCREMQSCGRGISYSSRRCSRIGPSNPTSANLADDGHASAGPHCKLSNVDATLTRNSSRRRIRGFSIAAKNAKTSSKTSPLSSRLHFARFTTNPRTFTSHNPHVIFHDFKICSRSVGTRRCATS